MKKLIAVAILAVGVAHYWPSPSSTPQMAKDEQIGLDVIEAAKRAVRERLKEPDSGDIKPGHVFRVDTGKPVTRTDTFIVCGTVNARNSFGGFTGPLGFVVNDGSVTISNGETSSDPNLSDYRYEAQAELCRHFDTKAEYERANNMAMHFYSGTWMERKNLQMTIALDQQLGLEKNAATHSKQLLKLEQHIVEGPF